MANDYFKLETKIEGGEELIAKLITLDANVAKSVKGAVRAGAKIIRDAAEANARAISQGHHGGRLVAFRARSRQGQAVVASIYPAKGHAELRPIELGTKAGRRWAIKGKPFTFWAGDTLVITRAIQHPGTPARPWLRPAFDAQREAATEAVGETLRQAIEEARVAAEGNDGD